MHSDATLVAFLANSIDLLEKAEQTSATQDLKSDFFANDDN